MNQEQPISRVVDLTDKSRSLIYGMTVDEAVKIVSEGDPSKIGRIEGQFALVGREGTTVRMVRTIGRLMRYFIAKRAAGPVLVVSDRIDRIRDWLVTEGLADQFHPSYTRMVPAHHLVGIRLIGCPDPNPTYTRFFTPVRDALPTDLETIGRRYVGAVYDEIVRWLRRLPADAPIGVCFSGGIDSGSVFLLAYHAIRSLGMNPARLKAFTLAIDERGADVGQARAFLETLDLELFLETIDVAKTDIDLPETIRVVEDYKPLDIQAAAMLLALCKGIRERYPDWRYLLDGDGGDENLKDYPIEENPELTIRSVLSNPLLYQEGWGVEAIKHSLTYSGGQSRGYARTYAPTIAVGFEALSPYVAPSVIRLAESIPFIALTEWDEKRLYALKGDVVSRGVRHVTGMEMPVFEKRRFQRGVLADGSFDEVFPQEPRAYREIYDAVFA